MKQTRKAFTLIELLVAVALLVILTGIVVWVFTRTVKLFITADARAQIYQNVRSGLDTIRRDIMTAEPIIAADNTNSGLQRLRLRDMQYNNEKWPGSPYPADELQIWNLKSMLKSGQTGSCYAKYWLDVTSNARVPILKRRTIPVDTVAGAKWLAGTVDGWPGTNDDKNDYPAAYVDEELMQYVVGLDVEPYYTNYLDRDPYWTLSENCSGGTFNQFQDNAGAAASFFLVGWNPTTGVEDYAWTPPTPVWGAGPAAGAPYTGTTSVFNISSIVASGTVFPKRAAFSTAAPSALQPNGTANGRSVPALPRGLRFTFYVRDEHSNEQRSVQQVIWMPMWGS